MALKPPSDENGVLYVFPGDTITCVAIGNPEPTVRWLILYENDTVRYTVDNHILTITDVLESGTKCNCTANNHLDVGEFTIVVQVVVVDTGK